MVNEDSAWWVDRTGNGRTKSRVQKFTTISKVRAKLSHFIDFERTYVLLFYLKALMATFQRSTNPPTRFSRSVF